ncbi:MAG TPA: hypothetical protein VJ036_01220, partial [bacterium]|nr:hypothetical protein [bacterium]
MGIDIQFLAAAFGGGVLGAALGALPAFIMTGFTLLAGIAAGYFGSPEAANVIAGVGFGPVLAPWVAFAGGVAAASYASSRGMEIEAKDIGTPLAQLNNPGVLLVGGIFGVIGWLLFSLWNMLGLPTDTGALTVALSAMIARGVFLQEGPLGTLTEEARAKGGIMSVTEGHCWLPWQSDWGQVAMIGIGFGFAGGLIGIVTGEPVLGFAISASSLVFLRFAPGFPVTHHITLPAG